MSVEGIKVSDNVKSVNGLRWHEFSLHVPYAHIDKMGFVYYANYFVYFEMARSALLRDHGLPYTELEKRGVMLPVVQAVCNYRKPAHFDDLLTVRSRCLPWKGPRLCIAYEIVRAEDLLAEGHTEHVCMRPDGRPLRPDADLKKLVECFA